MSQWQQAVSEYSVELCGHISPPYSLLPWLPHIHGPGWPGLCRRRRKCPGRMHPIPESDQNSIVPESLSSYLVKIKLQLRDSTTVNLLKNLHVVPNVVMGYI